MTHYSKTVSYEIAKKLCDYNVKSENGFYTTEKTEDINEGIFLYSEDARFVDGVIPAPTYGEVFDYFSEMGIIITLIPFHTFALFGNVGYTWEISYPLMEGSLITITEESEFIKSPSEDGFGGSFCLIADDAIKRVIKHQRINNEN